MLIRFWVMVKCSRCVQVEKDPVVTLYIDSERQMKNLQLHPALTFAQPISSDIFRELAAWFFEHHVFQRWLNTSVAWQLHCIGGPGAGKSTLASLTKEFLARHFHSRSYPIASIFFVKRIAQDEIGVLEDFLNCFYLSLSQWEIGEEELGPLYKKYTQAIAGETRAEQRLLLLREAVHARLQNLKERSKRAFAIIDGIDCCGPSLRLLINLELTQIQQFNVNVLLTSRIAVFEHIQTFCDQEDGDGSESESKNHDYSKIQHSSESLELFFTCRRCDNILCFPCKEAGLTCKNCKNNDTLEESYDHVNVSMARVPQDAINNYIKWDLEREHGDLGLGSSARKPPHSALGLSIRNDQPHRAAEIVRNIQDLCISHVGMAKARLELVHQEMTVEAVLQRRSQLPANIVAMFNDAMEDIQCKDNSRQNLGLKAIAAAAQDSHGMPLPDLKDILQEYTTVHIRSGEEIIDATNGFLWASLWDVPQDILPFPHDAFINYVKDDYNEKLFLAHQELSYDEVSDQNSEAEHLASLQQYQARFEPRDIYEEPAEIMSPKLVRRVTIMDSIREEPSRREEPPRTRILRKGTRPWQEQ